MPLVVFVGIPSCGKSKWAHKLAEFLRAENKVVHIVREEELIRGDKNEVLDDSRKEKELRGKLKSEAQRLLNKDDVVIIDGLNYIKGYRYELFCMSKAVPTRQVTVQPEASEQAAWDWNEQRPLPERYTRPVFEHLIQRFEPPDPQNRWDSPYFSVLPDEELDMKAIRDSLYNLKPPKQNQSTQSKPLSDSNFVSSLEKVTSDIIGALMEEQKKGSDFCMNVEVPHSSIPFSRSESSQPVNLAQLTRLKRQFIGMTKLGPNVQKDFGNLFVQYLNSQFM